MLGLRGSVARADYTSVGLASLRVIDPTGGMLHGTDHFLCVCCRTHSIQVQARLAWVGWELRGQIG